MNASQYPHPYQHNNPAHRLQMVQPDNRLSLEELKQQCPLPKLLEQLSLGDYAKTHCQSPFRRDARICWGIFQTSDGWRFKDYVTGEHGDEITFLARHLNFDEREHYPALLDVYGAVARSVGHHRSQSSPPSALIGEPNAEPTFPPNRTGFGRGTNAQRKQLSDLRGFCIKAVNWATERGVLVFGEWQAHHCYGICDKSGRLVELRRLDGQNFPAAGEWAERESHTLEHSQLDWPVGLIEAASASNILLVQGIQNFIAAHEVILDSKLKTHWAPVAMRSASARISPEAHPYFKDKCVVIHYQDRRAAQTALGQLQLTDVANVRLFDTVRLGNVLNCGLYDFRRLVKSADNPHLPRLNTLLRNY